MLVALGAAHAAELIDTLVVETPADIESGATPEQRRENQRGHGRRTCENERGGATVDVGDGTSFQFSSVPFRIVYTWIGVITMPSMR
jgi:hypothetical protein